MAKTIDCTFWDFEDRCTRQLPIKVDTSLGAESLALRHACQDHCLDTSSPAWVQPADGSGMWFAYRMERRMGHFVRTWPTQEAAEMWLIHYCGG